MKNSASSMPALGPAASAPARRREPDLAARPRHRQVGERRLERAREAPAAACARARRQRRPRAEVRVAGVGERRRRAPRRVRRVLEVVQLAARGAAPCREHVVRASDRASSSDARARASRSSTSCSRAGEASMSGEYERRKNARSSSCDLMASRASRYGANSRIERGELADALPDRRRAPAAPRRRRRRARRRPRRTAAAADRRWRAPAAWRPAPRPRRAAARPCSISASWNARNSARAPSRGRRSREPVALVAQPLPRARTPTRPARARPSRPANASSRSRCAAGSSSAWCSCWPCRSTSAPRSFAQRRARRERAVDERAAAALRGDLAADDQLAAVRRLEDRLDGRGVLAGPDEVGARRGRRPAGRRRRRGWTCRRRFRR